MTFGEFHINMSKMYYIFDDNILNWMIFHFYAPGRKNRKRKAKYILDESKILPRTNHMKGRYTLMARFQGMARTNDGNIWMDSITCNLEHIANIMPRIAKVYFDVLY